MPRCTMDKRRTRRDRSSAGLGRRRVLGTRPRRLSSPPCNAKSPASAYREIFQAPMQQLCRESQAALQPGAPLPSCERAISYAFIRREKSAANLAKFFTAIHCQTLRFATFSPASAWHRCALFQKSSGLRYGPTRIYSAPLIRLRVNR